MVYILPMVMLMAMKEIEIELEKMAMESGASAFVKMKTWQVVTAHWVRLRCQFGCKNYGTRLSCPPYSPTPEETRQVLDEYQTAFLIRYDGFLGFDNYPPKDLPGAMDKLSLHVCNAAFAMERHAFLSGYYKAFSYGAHRCRRCDVCALAEGKDKCKYPVETRPSLESAGIDVFATAANAGIPTNVVKDRNILKPEMLPTYTLLLLE
jgi:predicted metal-binding protein